ncbi:MAG TPA: hypothetical protein VHE55_02115 [Fimbriimonadaceae bacterium]|nr:hypothetical protein [Fimbriimonadaceae bacterium]
MVANGYVRCSGCGGYLPAGAICGYCLQKQQAAAAPPQAMAKPRAVRPARHILTIALMSLAVCAVGLGSIFVIRSVGKMAHNGAPSGSLAGLTKQADESSTLDSTANQKVISALNSGNPQQALTEMQATGSTPPAPVMQASGSEAPPVMQTAPQQQQPPASLQTTPPPAKPMLEAGSTGMPNDVRKWLEHLQRIEQARLSLAATQLKNAVSTLVSLQAGDISHGMDEDGNDSVDTERRKQNDRAQAVGGNMATMQQAWKSLLTAFDSVPAPAECQSIKDNYDQVIGQTGSMILDIVGQIKSAANDPQAAVTALTAMQGTSKSRIDVPARASDAGVAKVCKHYDVVKWFDIQSDVGSGTMSQLGF